MAAAVMAAAVLLVGGPEPKAPDAFEQLARMGVEIDRQQVVMSTDDGRRMNLEQAARLDGAQSGEVALETGNERIALAARQRMKILFLSLSRTDWMWRRNCIEVFRITNL